MENLATVQRYLGGKKALGTPRNDLDLIAIIRKGLPVSVLASLCERLKMSEELVVASLGIARRTAARRKRQGGRLKPVESECFTDSLGPWLPQRTCWATRKSRGSGFSRRTGPLAAFSP